MGNEMSEEGQGIPAPQHPPPIPYEGGREVSPDSLAGIGGGGFGRGVPGPSRGTYGGGGGGSFGGGGGGGVLVLGEEVALQAEDPAEVQMEGPA